jgi:hypothetical protein
MRPGRQPNFAIRYKALRSVDHTLDPRDLQTESSASLALACEWMQDDHSRDSEGPHPGKRALPAQRLGVNAVRSIRPCFLFPYIHQRDDRPHTPEKKLDAEKWNSAPVTRRRLFISLEMEGNTGSVELYSLTEHDASTKSRPDSMT